MIRRLRLRARLRAQKRHRAHRLHQEHELNCTSLCCDRQTGATLQVRALTGDETEAARLRDLGVREGARVTILRDGDPLMVKEAMRALVSAAPLPTMCIAKRGPNNVLRA